MDNLRVVNNFKILHISNHACLSYRKGKLYAHPSLEAKPILFGNLPLGKKQRIFSRFRLTERLFRIEPRVAIEINKEEYLISFCGAVYRISLKSGEIIKEHNYRLGMNNTMNFCKIEGIYGFDDCIVYGEYWGNTNHEEVSIYARIDKTWWKVFTFPKRKVQHIHGIIADPYRNCVLILTGDKNEEAGIWIASQNFKDVKPLLIGSQRYRACVAFPVEEGIIYATDSPLEKNVIAIARKEKHGWIEHVLQDIPGPCIYGTEVDGKFVFATSVEPDSTIQGMKYWFTYNLGQGVRDRYSHVIMGNLEQGFKEIFKFKKDSLPMLLFQFGNIQFPGGMIKKNVIMYPVSVRKCDGKTIIYTIEED
jgi:hypothetical protein